MLLCFFFALIAAVYSRIFRLPCKSLAHFDVILDGFALTNTPAIATHHQSSRRQCVLHCISNPHCKSLNHNGLTSVCKLFNVGFNNATQSLGAVVGWSFLAATDEGTTCDANKRPCANDGVCYESCEPRGYTCSCQEYYYGDHCEDNVQSLLDKYCRTIYADTVARLDGSTESVDIYYWRCYRILALRADLLFWSKTTAFYFSRHAEITAIIRKHMIVGEYLVGDLNQSCSSACKATGRKCKKRIETINSIYMFTTAGISCKLPREATADVSPYYRNKEDPCYQPSTGFCQGFVRVHFVDCEGAHPQKKRLCRCV